VPEEDIATEDETPPPDQETERLPVSLREEDVAPEDDAPLPEQDMDRLHTGV